MPFWHGDGPGRPLELGRAIGAFTREIREDKDAVGRLTERHGLDPLAADNLLRYLDEQIEATGSLPDDRTIVVERFRDEIGDWRVCILSPFGARVHAPWAMALQHRLGEEWGLEVELMWSDDGIAMRLPEAVDDLPIEQLLIDPEDIDELVMAQLPNTALFASRFREASARALLLPRRRPDRRTPLWMQRQRAADLLQVAARYPDFPLLLETTRECLNDTFDVPALREVLGGLRSRDVRVVTVETRQASPFAQSLLFGWIAVYMYEGDAPLAERRAAALALDRDLLRDLLGAEELRELIDPGVLADLELDLQRLTDGRRARDPDELTDVLRVLGPLTREEVDARSDGPAAEWLDELVAGHPGHQGLGGGRGALRRGRGRLPGAGRARRGAPAGAAAGVHRPGRAAAGRPRRPLRPHPRTLPDPARGPAPRRPGRAGPARPRGAGGRGPGRAGRVPARRRRAGVVRRGGAASSCGAGRWPCCARRSSRSTGRPWPGSCPPGRGSACSGVVPRAWSRCSTPCRARPCPPRSWRPTSCPPAWRATATPTSTPCAPRARWCGSAPAPSGPPTAGSASSTATASASSCPRPTSRRRGRSTPPSWPTSSSGAPRSGPTWSRRRPRRACPTTSRPC